MNGNLSVSYEADDVNALVILAMMREVWEIGQCDKVQINESQPFPHSEDELHMAFRSQDMLARHTLGTYFGLLNNAETFDYPFDRQTFCLSHGRSPVTDEVFGARKPALLRLLDPANRSASLKLIGKTAEFSEKTQMWFRPASINLAPYQ